VAVININIQPIPVGAEARSIESAMPKEWSIASVPVPVPAPAREEAKSPTGSETSSKPTSPSGGESAEKNEKAQAAPTAPANTDVLTGRMALLMNRLMLEKSVRTLEKVSDYTATFFKQERIKGKLSDGQLMEIKMRHAPFSVYMKWLTGDKGRQVLYVAGENDNKMLVKFGGWKSRLPSLKLEPLSSLAMAESRHPITQAGLLELVREVLAYRERDLQHEGVVRCCVLPNQKVDDKECYCFTVEYSSAAVSETYRKSILMVDAQTLLPVAIKNYTWPEQVDSFDPKDPDGSTLIEFYSFSNVNLNPQLANSTFDGQNQEYRFR
jgi:hypothetical protein